MKKYFTVALIILILGSFSVVSAQEAAKYNFGSMQAAKELSISPGDEVETKLYFYNVYGNRITHITLFVSQAPEGWEIELEPELHNTTVDIAGITVNVTENLYVMPSTATDTIPADIPEGIEYISSSVGYIGAKSVKIKIKVPEDEEIGKEFNITISASAEWLGQTGAVAIKQSRDFDYIVTTVAGEFYEEIIEPEICTDVIDNDNDDLIDCDDPDCESADVCVTEITPGAGIPEGEGLDITGFLIGNAPWIGIIIVLAVLLAYFGFVRKPEEAKGYSYAPE